MNSAISKIQEYLKQNGIDAYIVFTSDDHGSEYIVDHFKTREFLCGFTGSAGTLVITKDESYLFTDGRYFIQAEEQLKGGVTKLMKIGEKGYPTLYELIAKLGKGAKVAFDFSTATVGFVEMLKKATLDVEIINNGGIIDEVWTDRPSIQPTPAYMLSDKVAGESVESKLQGLRAEIDKLNCGFALVASLDDIAWLFNLRGDDIEYNPVNYAYALISREETILFIDERKLDKSILKMLENNNVQVLDYDRVYAYLEPIEEKILIDKSKTNYALYSCIQHAKEVDVFPTTAKKAIKNAVEIKNMKQAHVWDGVAMVKFMRYLKERAGKEDMSEISLADKLEAFRRENKHFIELSFDTICGYASNGAIVHYSANEQTNKKVENCGLLLVDSGAQYRYGTTDITRTFAMGKISKEERRAFTLVLKSHIALAMAVFPQGIPGASLDAISRDVLYKNRLDFKHGTGHGVGYLLNVHEGPQSISPRAYLKHYGILPGMITSNEPGYYKAGEFGIRHENLVLCVEDKQTECGNFCRFETITLAPFDLDAIDVKMLTDEEKNWLNAYHASVYKKLKNHLVGKDLKFLARATRRI